MAVLILSSSRGGSTIFTEFLRRHPGLVHLPGEINPLLRLANLGYPQSGTGSDALGAGQATGPNAEKLRMLLEAQCGGYGEISPEQMVADVQERLSWQWPHRQVPRAQVEAAVQQAWPHQKDFERFTLEIVNALGLDAGLYDLPQRGEPPLPHPDILEEPPFILFAPWQRRQTGPLIIKTPSNAYRLPFFQRFFAPEPLRILHLTRNPGAAINGLMDGWLFHGFHSHALEKLQIHGYSERVPGGDRWWKFDLPPGWENFVEGRSLTEVCAFQWTRAQQAICAWPSVDRHTVRFEDFLRDPLQVMAGVCTWLDVPFTADFQAVLQAGLAPRMATARPRQRRWFDRHRELEPVLALPELQDLAAELGYHDREEWL